MQTLFNHKAPAAGSIHYWFPLRTQFGSSTLALKSVAFQRRDVNKKFLLKNLSLL